MPCPPPGDLPNSGIRGRSPALQADSLPSEPPGEPKNTGVGNLTLLQRIFLTQEWNQGFLHCRQTLYQLSYQFSSAQFSRSVVSDSLRPHESQHTRLPCPSPTPRGHTQTHVHRVSDAIQPSHPLSSPSPPAPNPSQHQSFPMSQLFA